MDVHDHLRDERSPRVAEDDDRQPRVLVVDDLGELPDRRDGRPQAPAPEMPELRRVVAVLSHARAAVAAQIARVHGVAGGRERVDERAIPPGMLADAVHQLHDRARRRLGGMDVVDDRDAVCIDELGHAHESRWRRMLAPAESAASADLLSNANELG